MFTPALRGFCILVHEALVGVYSGLQDFLGDPKNFIDMCRSRRKLGGSDTDVTQT